MPTTRRTIAIAGAVVAVGAAGLMTTGIALAEAPGRCLENVNVRAEPSIDAPIVAVCEAGTAVTTDRISDGFVQLTDLGGWAAAEFVEIDGRPAGTPGSAPGATDPSTLPADSDPDDDVADTPDTADTADDDTTTDLPGSGESYDDPLSAADDAPRTTPQTDPVGGLGGLLSGPVGS